MLLPLKKKQIVVAVSMLFGIAQLNANSQTEENLYIERGDIQVKKVIKTNAMGGQTVEYIKTRITPEQVAKQNKFKNNSKKQKEEISAKTLQTPSHGAIPLYMKDGGIQVSKVVEHNPMGVTSTQYHHTKLATPEKNQATTEAITIPQQSNETDVESSSVTAVLLNKEKTITPPKQVAMLKPDVNELDVVVTDIPPHQPRLVIQTDNPTGRERELLAKIKAKKMADLNLKKDVRILPSRDLMLTPDETLIKRPASSSKRPAKKRKTTKKQRKAEHAIIGQLEFTQANMRDVTRALADISGLNFVATDEAAKKSITVYLQNISVKNALEAITKNAGLWYRKDKDSGTFRIMSTKEYQKDLVVYREDVTKVYRLHQPNPMIVATAIRDLYGDRVLLSFGTNYDDFFTGEFNSGGVGATGINGGGRGGNQGGAGRRGAGRGQNSLRGGFNSGLNQGGARGIGGNFGNFGGNNQLQKFDEKKFGANRTGAITENLTADQIEKIQSAVDNDGNQLDGGALRGVTRAQQPIYITVNNQQNMVILRTSDTVAVAEIDALIKEIDQPTPQVLLEMQVLEVDVGDAYTQLFSFGAISKNGKHSFLAREDSDDAGTGKFVYTFIDDLISTKLELLEQTNQAKVVSSPILLASNNRTSRLFVGEERLLVRGATLTDATFNQFGGQLTPSRITYETEIRNIGNTLNITPKINADGTVTLGVFQDSSSVNEGAVQLPTLSNSITNVNVAIDTVLTSNIEGVVVAKDGLTVAIGGLIRASKSKRNSKIPVLGDLPYIGGLFNDRVESESRKELVLLITPHIMEDPSVSDDRSRDAVEPISIQEW